MKRHWVTRDIAAPPGVLWRLLVDTDRWSDWGPTVRAVELDAPCLSSGSRGRVQTAVGLWVPFEITRFEEGRAWSWKVGGVPATEHTVEAVNELNCRVAFGAPWVATPYLAVCLIALGRLDRLAHAT